MTRVAVAGFFHETNCFSPIPGDLDAFLRPATLPGLTLGDDIVTRLDGMNVPVTGAMRVLAEAGHTVMPIAWASAVPCGRVTKDAFETIAGMIVDGVNVAGIAGGFRPDGVYLDLHGAMVAEHLDDPELELIRRLRARLGPDVPVVASFDLHANLSPARVAALDGLAMFRSYPHLDMARTGARAARLLLRCLAGERFAVGFRQLPFLVPLHAQATGEGGPASGLYAAARELETAPGMVGAELALGFPPADVAHCGPSIVTLGTLGADTEAAADALERVALAAESQFSRPLPEATKAVRLALAASGRPVVIADTQDNPGAGGTGDGVGLLRALLDARAPDAVLALLHDPQAARQAHALGTGATARFLLGAHSGAVPERPVEAEFTVDALTDGRIIAQGPMYRGNRWEIGLTALLRHSGVRVLVAERRLQAADTAVLRHAGIEPEQHAIIVLKSSVHFRAEYEAIASSIIVAAAPGLHMADLRAYPYQKLRPGLRRMPQGSPP
ncbi:M81 family metallopeptidase [Limobrevibacterium gyesilva]|uniref:Microcystinase C n=1 Tax=Limobrevibacterium gyesilva TaxID=2991712 RepID=A0AA42CG33_9PROT|nr:M81 family metallopeptidase [Limobrevibacterium gyesilva]MCW3477289.1 M81 family metallopeptidase [Limobrevibacterium gyesilva]